MHFIKAPKLKQTNKQTKNKQTKIFLSTDF